MKGVTELRMDAKWFCTGFSRFGGYWYRLRGFGQDVGYKTFAARVGSKVLEI